MIVMKFGGASLANIENINKTCAIVKEYQQKDQLVIIVSAMKGVTDELYSIVESLRKNELQNALSTFLTLKENHLHTLDKITQRKEVVKVRISLLKLFEELENFIKKTEKKGVTPAREDFIASFGERLSCRLIAEALESQGMLSYPLDASYIMATTDDFGNATPIYHKTEAYLNTILHPLIEKDIIPVITGFIGCTQDGCTTTLGRGGSDLSAAFFANFLNASGLYLWKDVDGFYTADPHKDPNATLYETLTYDEAETLALNGAKVIYYKALSPVAEKKIPLYVKSFENPKLSGTTIAQ